MLRPERFQVSMPPSATARSGPTRRQRRASPSRITASTSSALATPCSTSHAHSRTSANCSRFHTNPGTSRRTTTGSLPSATRVSVRELDRLGGGSLPGDHLDGRHQERRVEVVRPDRALGRADRLADRRDRERRGVRRDDGPPAPLRAPARRTAVFSSRSSGRDSTRRSAPVAASPGSRGGRHAARGRAHLVRGGEHVPVEQRESLVDALLRAPEVPRVQPHLVTSERVLAPDLGSHQARTDDRHAHGS